MITFKDEIRLGYLDYLVNLVCDEYHARYYSCLMSYLYETPFEPVIIKNDINRIEDGLAMREEYCNNNNISEEHLAGPCSVLEVCVALARRCELEIMADDDLGDRTSKWFWYMMASMGLAGMDDGRFEAHLVRDIIQAMIERSYSSNGKGGMFYVHASPVDMRRTEIWNQMCTYLNTIIN